MNENNIKFMFDQLTNTLNEMKSDQKETNRKIDSVKKELKQDFAWSITKVYKKIDKLDSEKLWKQEFEPYRSFFQKANRLIWSLLIGARAALILVQKFWS